MKKIVLAAALAVLLLLAGCSSPAPEKNYYPIDSAQELSYDYSVTVTFPEGPSEQASELVIKPGAMKRVGSTDCTEFSFLFKGQEDHSECYFENAEGVFLAERVSGLETIPIEPSKPLLEKPYTSGTEWEWNGKEGEVESTLSGLIETIEPVEISGTEYEALRVHSETERSDGAKIISTTWYAVHQTQPYQKTGSLFLLFFCFWFASGQSQLSCLS
ncbi:MAG: hypothetical protein NT067_02850 [Candidatus Diapherotrites archaeon]|nr:hypothetical protein [Candidatus Diapherotrites archaeon]